MQKLTDKHTYTVVDRALRFLTLRLRSRPETAEMAASTLRTREQLKTHGDAFDNAFDERVALSAEVVYRDNRVDRFVISTLRRAAVAAFSDRPDAQQIERRLYHGEAPSVAMKPVANEEQERYVSGILERINSDATFGPLQSKADELARLQGELDDVIEKRKKARVQERLRSADLDEALDQARQVYNQMYPRLQLTFPDDEALVESFFLDLRGPAATPTEPT